MKKLLAFTLISIALIACSKESDSLPEVYDATILKITAEKLDGDEMPSGTTVYVYDASNNDLVYDLSDLNFLKLADMANTDGEKVLPIFWEEMQTNLSASGVVSNYLFSILNIDNELYYDTDSNQGSLLVVISTKHSEYSERIITSATEVTWNRGDDIDISKIFKSDDPLCIYEVW